MSTLNQELNAIKSVEDTLTANKVANFAYTQEAYDNNDADGVEEYNFNQEQNIPIADLSILRVNETVLTKGWRSQASAITRMLMNHFLGRLSYNLNKLNDNVSNLLSTLIAKAGNADGFATLDANGRIPYSQLPESAIEYKGQWDASTNTPTLADGTGTKGDFYIVSVAGTQNLGSGDIQFFVNDRVIYDGSVWSRLSAGDVKSVNNITPVNGNITLTKADVGLGNVDNTSDSDLPALNGTNKFTTAGAYNMLISIAPAFDAEQAYEVGNYITYQGRLYKCTTAHTGAWDVADFTLISVAEDLEKVAPLNYLLNTEQDQFKKWIDGKEVYRKIKQLEPDTFNQSMSFPQGTVPLCFCIYNDKLFIGTQGAGIYVTEDGKYYTQSSIVSNTLTVQALHAYKNKLYIGTFNAGLYVFDGLTTTELIHNVFSNLSISAMTTWVDPAQNEILFVGARGRTSTQFPYIWRSYDGISFSGVNAFRDDITIHSLASYNNYLYVGTGGYGVKYFDVQTGRIHDISSINPHSAGRAFAIYNNKLYVGSNYGLYISEDGVSFTLNTSLPTDQVIVSLVEVDGKLYAGNTLGFYQSEDGNNFTQIISPENSSIRITGNTIIGYKDKLIAGLDKYDKSLSPSTAQNISGIFPYTVASITVFPNLTVDQSVDSLIEIKLVVDGSNINPTFTQKAGNQVNLAIPSDAQSALFPAFDVYAVMEYTKP